MGTSSKIRLLLAILCATLLLTALIVQNTYTPKINLEKTAISLEDNLHKKEDVVFNALQNAKNFDGLTKISTNDTLALKTIKDFTTNNRIWVCTFNYNTLTFWSGVKVLPDSPTKYKEGASFIKEANGYYEVIKKTKGAFSVLFFLPIKLTYPYQNRYLKNTFDKDILQDDNIEIADFTDKNVYSIHSSNHDYLFSVKLKPNAYNHAYIYAELTLWLLGFMVLCILIHNTCNYLSNKGHLLWGCLALAGFIIVTRFVNLNYNWPDFASQFAIFNPKLYASNALFPSLGDFCINILSLCWFTFFLFQHRYLVLPNPPGKKAGYVITTLCTLGLIIIAKLLLNLFYGLLINSHINFDVTNVFNLTRFSVVGVVILCFSFLLFYLLNEVVLIVTKRLPIPDNHKMAIFFTGIAAITAFTAYQNDFSLFYILVGLFITLRAASIWYGDGKLTPAAFIGLIVICSLISALNLNHFQDIKEKQIREVMVRSLEVADDVVADYQFSKAEKRIINDEELQRYFTDPLRDDDYLKEYFQKKYFDGYLSKYGFKIYLFNNKEESISKDKKYVLNDFKDMVILSSLKVSEYFYRENDNFGFQSYFAILPISKNNQYLGTAIINLKAKPLFVSSAFPELLIDGDTKIEDEFKDYSYAYYSDDKLLSQSGKYVYSLINNEFKGKLKQYLFTRTRSDNDQPWYKDFTVYSHLIYQPNARNLIVVSRQVDFLQQLITSLTFFFIIILMFSTLLAFIIWSWRRIKIFNISNNQITLGLRFNLDNVLYKSRIQFSVIFTVVITLLIVGLITFRSISDQYRVQQDNMIHDKLSRIAAVFTAGVQKGIYKVSAADHVKFNEFADTYEADLTLYDSDGIPVLTTQPKLFEYGLLARRMNGKAWINLKKLQKSELLNNEIIGESNYKAAYVPIRNGQNTVAYLQLPYFANEADYNDRIGALLNAMINIYAVVFIAIGLFAFIISRQITAPLNFIQYNLSKTIYGKKNEPIKWDRDDEIGSLVKEYNKMIAALELSAQKLAQSERESAWREMAKQVAHEIKNPLTPLKLGLQLLDKSWKDKDPKFDQKFERFSKSFVEQIESLSSIASEFSAFAKMPDTRLERIDIFEMLGQAVTIFKHMDNVTIHYDFGSEKFINADRDQLLRCFNNLLKNSIEAIPADRPGKIDITHAISANNILIRLSDNGNGIPDNLRTKIFEPNFTTKSSGTGLGLAFVKNSIENAGGKVWFETIIGTGTIFYISLPLA